MKILSRFRAWWSQRFGVHLEDLQFILYTRRGCHLCEVALQQLRLAQRKHDFPLALVDIDMDPALVARYGDQVPVVAINGKVRFRGTVNEVLLWRLLRAEAARVERKK